VLQVDLVEVEGIQEPEVQMLSWEDDVLMPMLCSSGVGVGVGVGGKRFDDGEDV
jgi:hypothetical protein